VTNQQSEELLATARAVIDAFVNEPDDLNGALVDLEILLEELGEGVIDDEEDE
jgi:hypothetical protein